MVCQSAPHLVTARGHWVVAAAAAAAPTASAVVARQLSLTVAAAGGEPAPPGPRGWPARRTQRRAKVHTVRLAVESVAHTQGEQALRALLVEALSQVRHLHGLPAVPSRALDEQRGFVPTQVPIRAGLRFPGGDSTYLHCTALVDAWPSWLRDPWPTDTANQASPPVADRTRLTTSS